MTNLSRNPSLKASAYLNTGTFRVFETAISTRIVGTLPLRHLDSHKCCYGRYNYTWTGSTDTNLATYISALRHMLHLAPPLRIMVIRELLLASFPTWLYIYLFQKDVCTRGAAVSNSIALLRERVCRNVQNLWVWPRSSRRPVLYLLWCRSNTIHIVVQCHVSSGTLLYKTVQVIKYCPCWLPRTLVDWLMCWSTLFTFGKLCLLTAKSLGMSAVGKFAPHKNVKTKLLRTVNSKTIKSILYMGVSTLLWQQKYRVSAYRFGLWQHVD